MAELYENHPEIGALYAFDNVLGTVPQPHTYLRNGLRLEHRIERSCQGGWGGNLREQGQLHAMMSQWCRAWQFFRCLSFVPSRQENSGFKMSLLGPRKFLYFSCKNFYICVETSRNSVCMSGVAVQRLKLCSGNPDVLGSNHMGDLRAGNSSCTIMNILPLRKGTWVICETVLVESVASLCQSYLSTWLVRLSGICFICEYAWSLRRESKYLRLGRL